MTQENNTILKAGGTPVKRGQNPKLNVVFPQFVLDQIKDQAKEQRISKGELVRRLVMAGLGC